MRQRNYYVYILTNDRHTVLYTGVTNNLVRRVAEHETGRTRGFTTKYNVHRLVYFEHFNSVKEAIAREKQIKAGSRKKKIVLIEKANPSWRNVSSDL